MNLQLNQILAGDVLDRIKDIQDESVHCCITSPPYWGLRDYGVEGQLGLEATPQEYVERMVAVFREVRRVLRTDGTLWLNIGDSYAGSGRGRNKDGSHNVKCGDKQATNRGSVSGSIPPRHHLHRRLLEAGAIGADWTAPPHGLKCKDLIGIPWRLAFALQADGWWLRSDIIWAKPNPMPESVTDRPTKSHEYVFLLAKSETYHYDQDAVREPYIEGLGAGKWVQGWANGEGEHTAIAHATPKSHRGSKFTKGKTAATKPTVAQGDRADHPGGKNRRSVWSIPTSPFPEAHFATFPEKLVEPCILAGSPPGGVVLDPFMGSGTVALVALKARRNFIGIELNPKYAAMAERRIAPEIAQGRLA